MEHVDSGDHGRQGLQDIQEALRVSYDPRTSNATRQSTLQYLNDLKRHADAPQYGLHFASDPLQPPYARHFGLSLLEISIRYRWDEHSEEQAAILQRWVISLAQQITPNDPPYLRNKIAALWAEISKRAWASTWMDMDDCLAKLWDYSDEQKAMTYRLLVLSILETLSDDICVREDPVAMLRQEKLGQAINEIMIPQDLFKAHLETRQTAQDVRYTHEGWLSRICSFLASLAQMQGDGSDRIIACTLRALDSLKPTVSWISLQALSETHCVDHLLDLMSRGGVMVQTVSVFHASMQLFS